MSLQLLGNFLCPQTSHVPAEHSFLCQLKFKKIERSKEILQVLEFIFSQRDSPRLPANCEHLIQFIVRDKDGYDVTISTNSEWEGQ